MAGEPKIMDYLSCGRPDVSYHGVKAWRPELENFRRQIGIMYCGEYGKKPDGTADDSFFVAYNMHWEPHELICRICRRSRSGILCLTRTIRNLTVCIRRSRAMEKVEKKGGMPVMETRQFEVPPRTIVVFVERKYLWPCLYGRGHKLFLQSAKLFLWMLI